MFWIGYRFLVFLFELILHFSSLWDPRAQAFIEGRRHQDKKLESWLGANDHSLIQIHCASLGEYELSLPLYESLKKRYPNHKFLFSFFSSSGYDHAKIPDGCAKAFLPTDRKGMVKSFLDLIKPTLVVFVKYEYWFEYLKQLQKRNIPFGYVNINQQVYPFNLKFAQAKKLLNQSSFIFSSNEKTSEDLVRNGIRVDANYLDLRYTKSLQLLAEEYLLKNEIYHFFQHKKIIICGSVWKEDLSMIIPMISANQNFKWVLAPHKIDKATIDGIKAQLGAYALFSTGRIKPEDKILLIDTIGDLKYLYRFGTLNYVGGAFNTGLHNVIEPIAVGAPIVFGPQYQRFPEAIQLVKKGKAFSVSNKEEFQGIIKKLEKGSLHLDTPEWLHEMKTDLDEMTAQIGKNL